MSNASGAPCLTLFVGLLRISRADLFNGTIMNQRLCFLILLFPLLLSTSCRPAARPAKFSSVSEGFSPESTFKELGYTVRSAPDYGVSNPLQLYCSHSWQGVLIVPDSTNHCETVATVIRDALNRSLGGVCHDELTGPGIPNPIGKSGRLLYLKDGMQGEVHVWLFGEPSEATVSYAISLNEKRAIH
jgi:hypothetical protein